MKREKRGGEMMTQKRRKSKKIMARRIRQRNRPRKLMKTIRMRMEMTTMSDYTYNEILWNQKYIPRHFFPLISYDLMNN